MKCGSQWLTVGVGVDAVHGLALTVDLLDNGEAATLTTWVGFDLATDLNLLVPRQVTAVDGVAVP